MKNVKLNDWCFCSCICGLFLTFQAIMIIFSSNQVKLTRGDLTGKALTQCPLPLPPPPVVLSPWTCCYKQKVLFQPGRVILINLLKVYCWMNSVRDSGNILLHESTSWLQTSIPERLASTQILSTNVCVR